MNTWRQLFITTEFVDFAWKYARTISHSKKEIIDKIKADPENFFKFMTPSDLAWALLVYFNNKKKWEADILLAKKKAVEEAGKKGGKHQKKRKAGATKKQASVEEEEEDMPVVVRQRWTGGKKIAGGGDGYSAEGKKFYRRMCWIFGKKIEVDEWKDVWTEYWKEEERSYIVPRKKG